MRIAIDASPLESGHKVRGVGFYTKNLIKALGKNVEAVNIEKEDLARYDLIHIPYFSPFIYSLPKNITSHKFVVTVHDLIPLIYPEHYKPGIKGRLAFIRQKRVLKKAAAVVTDSETSKKDIVRFLSLPPEKVFPIHLAPGDEFKKTANSKLLISVKKKYNLPDKFVLYVGDINYNKNIPGLIQACQLAQITLVMVGKQARELESLDLNHPELVHLKEVRKFKDSKDVMRLGFVSDKDLVTIYNLATVYCQPSFYEGFGLPILQAMACGTPIVAAKTQALVEIGEGACLFADPKNPREIADAIIKVLRDNKLREELIKRGVEKVKDYSWEKVAKETLEVYKHA